MTQILSHKKFFLGGALKVGNNIINFDTFYNYNLAKFDNG